MNHRFVLPTLSSHQHDVDYIGPDFRQLIMSLSHSSIRLQPDTNLFYSLLVLEPSCEQYSFGKFNIILFINCQFNSFYLYVNYIIIGKLL